MLIPKRLNCAISLRFADLERKGWSHLVFTANRWIRECSPIDISRPENWAKLDQGTSSWEQRKCISVSVTEPPLPALKKFLVWRLVERQVWIHNFLEAGSHGTLTFQRGASLSTETFSVLERASLGLYISWKRSLTTYKIRIRIGPVKNWM